MNEQELRTNKQELISKYELLKNSYNFNVVATDGIISDLKRLDEPKSGHADEAPRYVKNILARLRELPLHDREIWLKAIMSEFERDFSHAIWREGYKQGKFEGEWVGQQLKDADKIRQELNKPVIPQFVADWLSNLKSGLFGLNYDSVPSEIYDWVYATEDNLRKLHLAFVYGYEVGEEKRYQVVMPNVASSGGVLTRIKHDDSWIWIDTLGTIVEGRTHTRKELEEASFGWVFSCKGVEIEEVEE